MAAKSRSVESTRLALIRAAEKLFAERGFDAVSLREVSVAAGQANNSAVSYHFGNREGLIDAILERHSTPIQDRYVAQLDALELHGALSLRTAVEIMVLPIIAKLDDPDGGWAYISICAQLSVNPNLSLVERPVGRSPQILRLMKVMWGFTKAPPEIALFRQARMANTLYAAIVSWYRLVQTGNVGVSREVFEQDLIDAIVEIACREASPETLAALARVKAKSSTVSPSSPAEEKLAPTDTTKRKSANKKSVSKKKASVRSSR